MNALLNYLVEANLALCISMGLYALLLRRETDFNIKRVFLLTTIAISIVGPFLHLNTSFEAMPSLTKFVPTLADILPPRWLPEVTVYANAASGAAPSADQADLWSIINAVYALGLAVAAILFIVRIIGLLRIFARSDRFQTRDVIILESNENRSSFSFFKYIYIGQAGVLSPSEKALIIRHELVHARRLHSFDILIVNVIGIFFWFNPIIRLYKKTFIQVHEFEADARAVEHSDVDDYCSLLAKVALLSADFKLANHFSNSLTVKRIEMMRKLKSKIRPWKLASLAITVPCLFFAIACQDQLDDVTDIARNSTNALIVPEVVQKRYDELKKSNPKANYVMLELNEEGAKTLEKMEKAHGIPYHVELFTPDADNYKYSVTNTSPTTINVHQSDEWSNAAKGLRTFAIFEYDANTRMISELSKVSNDVHSKNEDDIYSMVEHPAEFPGGIDALIGFLKENVRYPESMRSQAISGTVFVSFVVEKDGSITGAEIVKSVAEELDKEAIRVVSAFPKWAPGSQDGEIVRSRFVVPLKFALQ